MNRVPTRVSGVGMVAFTVFATSARLAGLRLAGFMLAAIILAVWTAVVGPASAEGAAPRTVSAATAGVVEQAPGSAAMCTARYHVKLGGEILAQALATQTIADSMRSEALGMPGRWLFWDGSGVLARSAHQVKQMSTPQIDLQSNRLCARQVLMRGGRIRCLSWEALPADYKPPQPEPEKVDPGTAEVTNAERLFAGRLASRVSRKGAFSELEHGSAFYHIVQRTTDELAGYARQPHRDTMCTGAQAMVGFYRDQLRPLAAKAAAVRELDTAVSAAAVATTRSALGQPLEPDSAKPVDLALLLGALLDKFLDSDERASLASLKAPIAILAGAGELLTEQRLEAILSPQRALLRRALRNIEFAVYAAFSAQRLSRLDDAFATTLQSIIQAHTTTCTCQPQ